jgi:hypothetical protein
VDVGARLTGRLMTHPGRREMEKGIANLRKAGIRDFSWPRLRLVC